MKHFAKIKITLSLAVLATFLVSNISATAKTLFPKAPEWAISEWVVGPPTTLKSLRGKVVVIDFFQLWCPGCNKFSIPLVSYWEEKYKSQQAQGKIAFVSIHTVFEGHNYQTNKRLRKFVVEKGMHHPVGVDLLPKGSHLPTTMLRYKTRGTPEIAIIGKNGRIRFQKFGGFENKPVEKLIEELMAETTGG